MGLTFSRLAAEQVLNRLRAHEDLQSTSECEQRDEEEPQRESFSLGLGRLESLPQVVSLCLAPFNRTSHALYIV